MTSEFDSLRDLIHGVRSLVGASAPTEVFRRLVEAGRSMSPAVSVFLIRKGEVQGWTSSGHDPATAEMQKNHRSSLDRGWLGKVIAHDGDLLEKEPSEEYPSGRPESDETVGGALRVAGRPLAVVVFERAPGETPWHPEGLELLFAIARLRLELILLNRRSQASAPAPEPVREEPAPVPAEPTAVDPVETPSSESPEYEAARRYAKLVATDIRLYNEEAVLHGRRDGDLAERLGEHLDRGRETFLERHGDLGPVGLEILHDAYVEVLGGGDSQLIPSRP